MCLTDALRRQIFTAEDAQLPREEVSSFLLNISPGLCAGYMEYLIDEASEANPTFHDRLAELYLKAAQDTRTSESERRFTITKRQGTGLIGAGFIQSRRTRGCSYQAAAFYPDFRVLRCWALVRTTAGSW